MSLAEGADAVRQRFTDKVGLERGRGVGMCHDLEKMLSRKAWDVLSPEQQETVIAFVVGELAGHAQER